MEYSYENITVILAELSAYRRSALTVRVDLEKQILQWKDSLRWNSGFMRSLSADIVRSFRERLADMQILQWERWRAAPPPDSTAASRDVVWQVTVSFPDGQSEILGGEKDLPAQWTAFAELIESVARIPFKI